MIKARGITGHEDVVFLGLTGENVARLANDEPIMFRLRELGDDLPELNFVILYGKTDGDLAAELGKLGAPLERKHDTAAHLAAGGFGIFAEGCAACEADGPPAGRR